MIGCRLTGRTLGSCFHVGGATMGLAAAGELLSVHKPWINYLGCACCSCLADGKTVQTAIDLTLLKLVCWSARSCLTKVTSICSVEMLESRLLVHLKEHQRDHGHGKLEYLGRSEEEVHSLCEVSAGNCLRQCGTCCSVVEAI